MGLFSCFSNQIGEQKFRAWLSGNSDRLFGFESDQEKIFNELSAELAKINPDLTFEFGPVENNRRDFVISAGGIKSAFWVVESLYDVKPQFDK